MEKISGKKTVLAFVTFIDGNGGIMHKGTDKILRFLKPLKDGCVIHPKTKKNGKRRILWNLPLRGVERVRDMVLSSKTQPKNKKLAREVSSVSKSKHKTIAKPKMELPEASSHRWEEYEYYLERIRWNCQVAGQLEAELRKENPARVGRLRAYWLKRKP